MKNKLKYKNKVTIFGKLRMKLHALTNWNYSEVVVAKHEISLDSYKYLYRNLVKINKAFSGKLLLTLNKSEYAGQLGYIAVISLKVNR